MGMCLWDVNGTVRLQLEWECACGAWIGLCLWDLNGTVPLGLEWGCAFGTRMGLCLWDLHETVPLGLQWDCAFGTWMGLYLWDLNEKNVEKQWRLPGATFEHAKQPEGLPPRGAGRYYSTSRAAGALLLYLPGYTVIRTKYG